MNDKLKLMIKFSIIFDLCVMKLTYKTLGTSYIICLLLSNDYFLKLFIISNLEDDKLFLLDEWKKRLP